MVKHVQIKTFDRGGKLAGVVNFDDVRAQDGVVLDRVERGLRIEAEVLVQTGTPPRTYVLRDETTSRLRPDLVVNEVTVPPQTLTSSRSMSGPRSRRSTATRVRSRTSSCEDRSGRWAIRSR